MAGCGSSCVFVCMCAHVCVMLCYLQHSLLPHKRFDLNRQQDKESVFKSYKYVVQS